jgi:hypothetical protein
MPLKVGPLTLHMRVSAADSSDDSITPRAIPSPKEAQPASSHARVIRAKLRPMLQDLAMFSLRPSSRSITLVHCP